MKYHIRKSSITSIIYLVHHPILYTSHPMHYYSPEGRNFITHNHQHLTNFIFAACPNSCWEEKSRMPPVVSCVLTEASSLGTFFLTQ